MQKAMLIYITVFGLEVQDNLLNAEAFSLGLNPDLCGINIMHDFL